MSARRKGKFTGAEATEDPVWTQDSKEVNEAEQGESQEVWNMRPEHTGEAEKDQLT